MKSTILAIVLIFANFSYQFFTNKKDYAFAFVISVAQLIAMIFTLLLVLLEGL